MAVILGIDPGLSGALSYIDGSALRSIYDMPTLELARGGKKKNEPDFRELARIIREEIRPDVAVVEQVGAMPGQGVSSMFAFGKCYGGILAALAAFDIRVEPVPPQTWKRFHRIVKDSGKDASRALAKNLFPDSAGLFARVKDDGRAEAALIAAWGRHQTFATL